MKKVTVELGRILIKVDVCETKDGDRRDRWTFELPEYGGLSDDGDYDTAGDAWNAALKFIKSGAAFKLPEYP